jgi:D-lactate dehydrogenase
MTNNKNRIVFLEVEPVDNPRVLSICPDAQIDSGILTEEEIAQKYPEVEVLCTFIYTKISENLLSRLPNLKLIITRSVGYNHVDVKAAESRGIYVCNVPDYGSHVIAEHVFALLLSQLRHVREADEKVEGNNFDFHGLRGDSLKGKTLGVLGTGKIGRQVARIASLGFLMNVIAYDKFQSEDLASELHFKYVETPEEIWEKSDIISLHLPLFPDTVHLIDKKSIAQMKNGVVIVNTARGELIDTAALIEGLESKKISYASLDVLEDEKNTENQELNKKLIALPQVITTPHIAFYSNDAVQKMYESAGRSISRYLNGEKLVCEVH